MKNRWILAILTLFSIQFQNVSSQVEDIEKLMEMDFEALINMEVTSVSKKAERLQDVPSSIYVITSEDIVRSSAQNLMQLLRDHVPGYWGAANDYRLTDGYIRNTSENSVLILLDGTPMMDVSFVQLDNENFDIPFDQIERIEVIKGSGGTVYGANSASGVISIMTKIPGGQKKILASTEYAMPGKVEANLIATPFKSERFSVSLYGKLINFSGFKQIDVIEKEQSIVPKHSGIGDSTIANRFTGDDNTFTSFNGGYNLFYNISEKFKFSSALNFVGVSTNKYIQAFNREESYFESVNNEPRPFMADSAILQQSNKTRLTGNMRGDYSFTDKHSLFVRFSTNLESGDYAFGGGYQANKFTYDFEVQDNISILFNNFSLGVNYRSLGYELTPGPHSVVMVLDQNPSENLKGFFVQDKITLMEGKLNFYLGAKAENFSLIGDKYYFSPMAKFTLIPSENYTLWGGFTQSYTTPGFNQTNIELDLFRATSDKLFPFIFAMGAQSAYDQTFSLYRSIGYDSTSSAQQANVYINSPEIQAKITSGTNDELNKRYPGGNVNFTTINGSNIKPTSFQNYEIGFRAIISEKLKFETNYFYSVMLDGLTLQNDYKILPSPTRMGENVSAFFYGNYVKGYNQGIETVLKMQAMKNLSFEISHNLFDYHLEYQDNNDFETDTIEYDKNNHPILPKNTFKGKIYYDILPNLKFTFSGVVTSKYFIRNANIVPYYSYVNQRFETFAEETDNNVSIIGAKFENRIILNFRVDQMLLNGKMNLYAYVNDLTRLEPFVEGVSRWDNALYPRQVGGFVGIGVKYFID